MTPEEAVRKVLDDDDVFVRHMHAVAHRMKALFDDVVATAKESETLRCAARAERSCNNTGDSLMVAFGKGLAHDLLRTGGLEVEK